MTLSKKTLRILVIGDLHGQMPKIHFKEFDAIIATGDFCLEKEIWKHIKVVYKRFLKNPKDHSNWYSVVTKSVAKRLIKKSLAGGRRVLERLNEYNVPIYVIPGNWDFADKDDEWSFLNKNYYTEYLIKDLKNIHDCHSKVLKIGECNIIGYGLVNGPELLKYRNYKNIEEKRYKKNEERYQKLIVKYDKLFKKTSGKVILLTHNVPYNTPLDKIVNKDSPMNGLHYGSNLARDMIEKHKPLICIAGHMHEHYGTCRIRKTTVLNAGFGGKNNTLLELQDGKIRSIKFYGKKK